MLIRGDTERLKPTGEEFQETKERRNEKQEQSTRGAIFDQSGEPVDFRNRSSCSMVCVPEICRGGSFVPPLRLRSLRALSLPDGDLCLLHLWRSTWMQAAEGAPDCRRCLCIARMCADGSFPLTIASSRSIRISRFL